MRPASSGASSVRSELSASLAGRWRATGRSPPSYSSAGDTAIEAGSVFTSYAARERKPQQWDVSSGVQQKLGKAGAGGQHRSPKKRGPAVDEFNDSMTREDSAYAAEALGLPREVGEYIFDYLTGDSTSPFVDRTRFMERITPLVQGGGFSEGVLRSLSSARYGPQQRTKANGERSPSTASTSTATSNSYVAEPQIDGKSPRRRPGSAVSYMGGAHASAEFQSPNRWDRMLDGNYIDEDQRAVVGSATAPLAIQYSAGHRAYSPTWNSDNILLAFEGGQPLYDEIFLGEQGTAMFNVTRQRSQAVSIRPPDARRPRSAGVGQRRGATWHRGPGALREQPHTYGRLTAKDGKLADMVNVAMAPAAGKPSWDKKSARGPREPHPGTFQQDTPRGRAARGAAVTFKNHRGELTQDVCGAGAETVAHSMLPLSQTW